MSIFMRCLTKMVITEYTQSFQTDRQRHIQTDRQISGWTDGHRRTDRFLDGQMARQTDMLISS